MLTKEAMTLKLTGDISADSLKAFVSWLQGLGTRFALSDGHRDVALSLKNRFIRMGYSDTRIDSFRISKTYNTVIYQQWQYNVIATLQGNTASDSICVAGGHYDDYLGTGDPFTIDPGANDNASGTAAILELARVMKKNKYQPGNTIQFIAFGAEEMGLLGSSAYAINARTTLKQIKLMLNNDMIAYEPDNNTANWSVNIIDYNNSHYIRTEAEELCTKYTLLKYYNNNTYSNASDSYSFYNNGYKALFFFSNKMDPNYHTLADVISNCNFGYCKEIVKLNCAILVNKN
jgi:Zn-dependent M28 family amino/carboxypeptidase